MRHARPAPGQSHGRSSSSGPLSGCVAEVSCRVPLVRISERARRSQEIHVVGVTVGDDPGVPDPIILEGEHRAIFEWTNEPCQARRSYWTIRLIATAGREFSQGFTAVTTCAGESNSTRPSLVTYGARISSASCEMRSICSSVSSTPITGSHPRRSA